MTSALNLEYEIYQWQNPCLRAGGGPGNTNTRLMWQSAAADIQLIPFAWDPQMWPTHSLNVDLWAWSSLRVEILLLLCARSAGPATIRGSSSWT